MVANPVNIGFQFFLPQHFFLDSILGNASLLAKNKIYNKYNLSIHTMFKK